MKSMERVAYKTPRPMRRHNATFVRRFNCKPLKIKVGNADSAKAANIETADIC